MCRYFGGNVISWESFVRQFESLIDFKSFNIVDAIEVITCHRVDILKQSKVPVFIFIDEYRCLAKRCLEKGMSDPESVVQSAIGAALHSLDRPTILISTLDYAPLLREGASVTRLFCQRR